MDFLTDSILLTVKKSVGIEVEEDNFDNDLILLINSALSILVQLGVGPEKGFSISDSSGSWSDFLGASYLLDMAKEYVYLTTRLIFDPPANSFVVSCIEKRISELEWRITVAAEEQKGKE